MEQLRNMTMYRRKKRITYSTWTRSSYTHPAAVRVKHKCKLIVLDLFYWFLRTETNH